MPLPKHMIRWTERDYTHDGMHDEEPYPWCICGNHDIRWDEKRREFYCPLDETREGNQDKSRKDGGKKGH